ncbi:lysophospholipase L1-like esterase [Synechococcus sp. PCC 7502]|uniref:SGNH/GDSL hydrolase family protein n=1 Tax=Synechococcus sp. PCC 7502 TaxID=1173263 RepID=UPI00029F8D29|nr:SGNH/GDSL hydrolase family protein [Synechococcus sp. PCC 7502]AFY75208.1 lysophospholipase L1-like esterase [Synechococcus sp. PCC 7502]
MKTSQKIFKVLNPILIVIVLGIAYLAIAYYSMLNYAFKEHPTVAFTPGAEFFYSRQADANSEPQTPPFRYVVLGDSTSVGQGAKVQADNYSSQYAQLVLLKKYPAIKIYNLAVSGAKTKDVLSKQVQAAIALEPNLIMLSIGANDVTGLTGAEEFQRNYTMILQQLTRTNAKIVLLNIPAFSTSPLLWEPYRSAAHYQAGKFNQIIEAIAATEPSIRVVDIYRGTEPDFRRFPKLNFSQDHFHPSSAGYAVWTRVIAQTLN